MAGEYNEHPSSARLRPIGDVLEEISDPGHHVGGGTAAAVAGALAGASAALVARLSATRKRNAERAAEINSDLERLIALQDRLLAAAHEDERALDELMARYRDPDASDATMVASLQRAARSTIEIALAAAEVCEIAARQAPIATKFTISDLGAAASIARGAVTAALLTAETNIALLATYSIGDDTLDSLRTAVTDADRRSAAAADSALRLTRERIGA